jgi:hypothetical protein
MRTNIPATSTTQPGIEFSFRGHVSQPSFGAASRTDPNYGADFPAIVIYSTPDNSLKDYPNQQRRCVVIASLLGAIRVGIYTGDLTDAAGSPVAIDANKCQANLEGTRS